MCIKYVYVFKKFIYIMIGIYHYISHLISVKIATGIAVWKDLRSIGCPVGSMAPRAGWAWLKCTAEIALEKGPTEYFREI